VFCPCLLVAGTSSVGLDPGSWTGEIVEALSEESAYSSLAELPDGRVGLLYEQGDVLPYDRIRFAALSFDWVSGGR